jgi:hypothetical protein
MIYENREDQKVLERIATCDGPRSSSSASRTEKCVSRPGLGMGRRSFYAIRCSRSARRRRPGAVARGARKPDEWDPPIEC